MSGGQTSGEGKTKQGCGTSRGAESADSAFISTGNANKCEEAFEDASLLSIHGQPRKRIRDFFLASVIRQGKNETTHSLCCSINRCTTKSETVTLRQN